MNHIQKRRWFNYHQNQKMIKLWILIKYNSKKEKQNYKTNYNNTFKIKFLKRMKKMIHLLFNLILIQVSNNLIKMKIKSLCGFMETQNYKNWNKKLKRSKRKWKLINRLLNIQNICLKVYKKIQLNKFLNKK